MRGLPGRPRRSPRRCRHHGLRRHRITVSGRTTLSGSRQRGQKRASEHQNSLSWPWKLRPRERSRRSYIASCWRSATFSSTRSRRSASRALSRLRQRSTRVNMFGPPPMSAAAVRILPGWGFGAPQPPRSVDLRAAAQRQLVAVDGRRLPTRGVLEEGVQRGATAFSPREPDPGGVRPDPDTRKSRIAAGPTQGSRPPSAGLTLRLDRFPGVRSHAQAFLAPEPRHVPVVQPPALLPERARDPLVPVASEVGRRRGDPRAVQLARRRYGVRRSDRDSPRIHQSIELRCQAVLGKDLRGIHRRA